MVLDLSFIARDLRLEHLSLGPLLLLIHAMWADRVCRLACCNLVCNEARMLLVFGVPLYLALLLGCLATITWSVV